MARRLEQHPGVAPGLALTTRIHGFGEALRGEQLLLCRDEHRAVQRQQRLTAAHRESRRVHKEVLDEPVDLGRDLGDAEFGRHDLPHGAYRALQRAALHHSVGDADRLYLRRREAHRLTLGAAPCVAPPPHAGHVGHRVRLRLAAATAAGERQHDECEHDTGSPHGCGFRGPPTSASRSPTAWW